MQENNSGNNLSSSQINKPLEDYYLNKNGYNDSPHGDDNARKKKIVTGLVAVAVVIAIIIIIAVSLGNSMNGIEIVGEQLATDPYYTTIGDYLYPIVVVKVKNTSNTTKKVSFEANFYADGNLLGSDQASYITLAPGDEAFLHAQSDRGYRMWSSHEYSYKITKWHVYS